MRQRTPPRRRGRTVLDPITTPRRESRQSRTGYPSREAFIRADRVALFARAGGFCQLCGVPVVLDPGRPDSMIAGHVLARSEGG